MSIRWGFRVPLLNIVIMGGDVNRPPGEVNRTAPAGSTSVTEPVVPSTWKRRPEPTVNAAAGVVSPMPTLRPPGGEERRGVPARRAWRAREDSNLRPAD